MQLNKQIEETLHQQAKPPQTQITTSCKEKLYIRRCLLLRDLETPSDVAMFVYAYAVVLNGKGELEVSSVALEGASTVLCLEMDVGRSAPT